MKVAFEITGAMVMRRNTRRSQALPAWRGERVRSRSQDEISGHEVRRIHGDAEVHHRVAVEVALQEAAIEPQLASDVVEVGRADIEEGLIAGEERVRIDLRQIDPVASGVREVGDPIVRGDRRVA